MKEYLDLLWDVAQNGVPRQDRTGTGTVSVFGRQIRMDIRNSFPLLTTKKLHLKSIIYELLWMLKGDTNIKYLNDHGVTIWDEWADEHGDLGPVYGKQWRHWEYGGDKHIDQIAVLVDNLKNNPYGRRHIVSAWNVPELEKMVLPPCHSFFQLYVSDDEAAASKYLSLQLYQRSADIFLGVPFNIASYALLLMMLAQVCGYKPFELICTYGDLHLYNNHFKQARTQYLRVPFALPKMKLNPDVNDINDFKYEDFTLENYNSHPHIKADVSV